MPNCYILRGLPGSGKSTLAESLVRGGGAVICCADDYHMDNGRYNWKPENVKDAHDHCLTKAHTYMTFGQLDVIIANTNTTDKEVDKYYELANSFGYTVFVLVVENRHGGKNIHNVPEETLRKMRERLRGSIRL